MSTKKVEATICKVRKTESFNYNVRRGQMPDMLLSTYHQLQQNETVEVTDTLCKWLLERGYVTEVSGE